MMNSVRSGLIICDATPVFESKSMRNDDLVPCACSFIQDGEFLHSVLSLSNFLFSVSQSDVLIVALLMIVLSLTANDIC